ncbi:jg15508 [Pararge aegeria aegeria]|uniref:Jg15508 protein n=1 Tax=Pararge aegeria aegeria TaxID=348720 RepID=A0A8S4RBE7_9NEOP|nr:jg15508 [Pararge aegeria aegeria]
MGPSPTNKQRTPSRCREWERQRRIKFNDAISTLGEVVKTINKANNNEEADNVQYPKIEIVQKAIVCLSNFVQEKTQLKADILALEVKLEAIEKQKNNKRDVSIQVTLGINKKGQNGKCVKLIMQQKPKEKKDSSKYKCPPKLPKLLPITNLKKENTIVMLPATPYIFPQRPVLFPQGPTIVLVDTSLQQLNKPTTIPIINRNMNDITKTTMVNVLPISAYSHPLSAKIKKSSTKTRNNTNRKNAKKTKLIESIDNKKEENVESKGKPFEELSKSDDNSSNDKKATTTEAVIKTSKDTLNTDKPKLPESEKFDTEDTAKEIITKTDSNTTQDESFTSQPTCSESSISDSNKETIVILPKFTTAAEKLTNSVIIQDASTKSSKIPPDKDAVQNEFKNKENKMHTIIDTTICESVVDGGNARLELAEELLAASPTAAFLMSFPLVSGNRADSPAEEAPTTNVKETNRRNETPSQQISYFDKSNTEIKSKTSSKSHNTTIPTSATNTVSHKTTEQQKCETTKTSNAKIASVPATTNENPFLNLPSIIPSSCTLTDSTFGLDFDCNSTKASQATNYTTSNNIFYKSDPFNTVKSTIYSTSSISSGHEFNSLGLYPCAMENCSGKNKSDYSNVEDNLMKINSSRLTYDIDLGWSHKGLDFVNCTTGTNTLHKDTILTTAATPFSTAYNPFNPDFHVPLVSNPSKKNPVTKASTFPEPISSFYSQSTNLWPEDVSSIHTNSNVSRNFIQKQQNYFTPENINPNMNSKTGIAKFDNKSMTENTPNIVKSSPVVDQHIVEKYTKKSPNKMHINWMTSEIRPLQNNCNQNQTNLKESVKIPYSQVDQITKKPSQNDSYFPINMHNFPTQSNHEEHQVWPTARPAGTTEISIEPPPINLPTLVGDLALGPHDKKKGEIGNRILPHSELQSCGNFLSVTQLMNRSSDNMPSRSNGPINEPHKSISSKQNISHVVNESNRKPMLAHPQICYGFNDSKVTNPYENITQFSQTKCKSNSKPDKSSKAHKNNYSAEALIRGGSTCNQKLHDNNNIKFMGNPQKYNDFNVSHDSGIAQVSHFPPILDYSENNFAGQQLSGTTLYNSTTNTISNSFYSNFMPGSSNLMAGNYAGGSFSSDFVDYSQVAEYWEGETSIGDVKLT